MKNFLSILSMLIFSISLNGQVGLSASAGQYRAQNWVDLFDQINGTNSSGVYGLKVGVDYWFRLKNRRIEFLPEISFGRYVDADQVNEFHLVTSNFLINTHIYIFDLDSDCNCPTFNKQGNFFSKGFFVQAGAGFGFANTKYVMENANIRVEETSRDGTYILGGGVGLDIGLSELVTVTPFFKFNYYLKAYTGGFIIEGIEEDDPALESSITELNFGIRLGFRWDKRNY